MVYVIMFLCCIDETSNNTEIQITDVLMPPKMKKKPKEMDLLLLGYPKKSIVKSQHRLLRSLSGPKVNVSTYARTE